MLPITKKNKRRRFIRYEIALEAVAIIDQSTTLRCLIMDFCGGGLFLGFKQTHADIPLHSNITVQFSIRDGQTSKNFEIGATVVHVNSAGLGVAIDNMPPSVFNALKKAANSDTTATLANRIDAIPADPRLETFKRLFKHRLAEKLSRLISLFFDSIDQDLKAANEHFELFNNDSSYDDLITTLHQSKECFISEYCHEVLAEIDHIPSFDHKGIKDIDVSDTPLSLIEKEEFEDWLKVSDIIRRLNQRYEQQLYRLTSELSKVFGIPANALKNPISPSVLCDSFYHLILLLDLSDNIKQCLYKTFERTCLSTLNDLYDQSEIFLLKQKHATDRDQGESKQFAKNTIKRVQRPTDMEERRAPTQRQSFPEPKSRPDVQQFTHSPLSQANKDQSLTQLTHTLYDLLTRTHAVAPTVDETPSSQETSAANEPVAYFSGDEIVAALSNLLKQSDDPGGLHLNSGALQRRLQQNLTKANKQAKQLSSSNRQQLEVYGRFFETLLNDSSISSNTKSYLEHLQLPLLSLPLQGHDFLDTDSHPARDIINHLAVLESAVNNNRVIKNTPVKDRLDKLIAHIEQESPNNPEVFAEVEQELNDLTTLINRSIDANIKRIVDSYQGQQKLEKARRAVQLEIDRRIAGKAAPSVIPLLLQSGWQNLMVIAELNKNQNPEAKQHYLKVLDDLIFWLYEQESVLNMQCVSIERTLKFIDQHLSSVCSNEFQRHHVMEELSAILLGAGSPKVRKSIKAIKIPPSSSEQEIIQTQTDAWTTLVEQLQVGDWITLEDREREQAMKLVWIGDLDPVYVFVDRDGMNKREFTKTALAERFRNASAKKIENLDAPLTDRTTNQLMQTMYGKLIFNATHDPETHLLTRIEFVKQLKNELLKPNPFHHMLCHLEVQDFRVITNICGSGGGQQLLQILTGLIAEQLKCDDLFARLGDNTFAILFKHCNADESYRQSKKLLKQIGESHFQWQEKSFALAANMGLVPFAESSYDIHQLLQRADLACMSAERSGHNQVLMFNDDDEALQRQHKLYQWIGHIDNVFSQNRLFVRCQMIAPIDPSLNNHRHYEILLGVKDETGRFVPPDHFIPAVERCKRMPEIDRWIIKTVFGWIEQNRPEFDQMDGFSINLSGQSINSEEFLEFLHHLLTTSNVPADKLTFEITETVVAENLVFTKRFIQTLKQFGCKFSLDDFGSGYASYSYLKNMNVDYLKIDGAFIKDIAHNPADVAIVKSMNEIAHSLGLKTIAEYVENTEIRDILQEIGVDYGQGYLIQKPIPITELLSPPD